MASLSGLRMSVYGYLGTPSTDRAYPPALVNAWIQDAVNALVADLPGDYSIAQATLAADATDSRVYTLSTQSSPITTLRQIRELRVTNDQGTELYPVDESQLRTVGCASYAIYGPDEAATIETSPDVGVGSALWMKYTAWPSDLSADDSVPSIIPTHFHDVIALMAARTAFESGGEGAFPKTYQNQLDDRLAQLRLHVQLRGGKPALVRRPDTNTILR